VVLEEAAGTKESEKETKRRINMKNNGKIAFSLKNLENNIITIIMYYKIRLPSKNLAGNGHMCGNKTKIP